MNSVTKSLADGASLTAFVEQQLDDALRSLPMVWRKGDGLQIERVISGAGRWAWRRSEQRERAWYIYSADRTAGIDLYYDLEASRDLEAFVLTHSNVNAGLLSQRWFIRKATLIRFTALTTELTLFGKASSLAQLVADICLSCEPNLDWPT